MRVALCGHEGPSKREAGGSEAREDGSRGCRDAREPRGVGILRNCDKDQTPPPQSLPKERSPADVLILTSGLRNRKRTKGGRSKPLTVCSLAAAATGNEHGDAGPCGSDGSPPWPSVCASLREVVRSRQRDEKVRLREGEPLAPGHTARGASGLLFLPCWAFFSRPPVPPRPAPLCPCPGGRPGGGPSLGYRPGSAHGRRWWRWEAVGGGGRRRALQPPGPSRLPLPLPGPARLSANSSLD